MRRKSYSENNLMLLLNPKMAKCPRRELKIKKKKLVRVFSSYYGTSSGPSKTQSPDQQQVIRNSPNPRSTEETEENAIWYPNASSAPFFSQEMSSKATFDQPYPQSFPPGYYSTPSGEVFFLEVNVFLTLTDIL